MTCERIGALTVVGGCVRSPRARLARTHARTRARAHARARTPRALLCSHRPAHAPWFLWQALDDPWCTVCSKNDKLSAGAIAGIVVGAAVFALVVFALLVGVFIARRERSNRSTVVVSSTKETSQGDLKELVTSPSFAGQEPRRQMTNRSKLALEQELDENTLPAILRDNRIALDDLKMVRMLGHGNFGEVWEARWHGAPVATKRLHSHRVNGPMLRAFKKECEFGAVLRHPNIVHLYGGSWSIDMGAVCESRCPRPLLPAKRARLVTPDVWRNVAQTW